MTNGISGNLGPVENNSNNTNSRVGSNEDTPEVRDITEEIRLKSVFEKSVLAGKTTRSSAPVGKKNSTEARKKYGDPYTADTDFTKNLRQTVRNHRTRNSSRSIFGGN